MVGSRQKAEPKYRDQRIEIGFLWNPLRPGTGFIVKPKSRVIWNIPISFQFICMGWIESQANRSMR